MTIYSKSFLFRSALILGVFAGQLSYSVAEAVTREDLNRYVDKTVNNCIDTKANIAPDKVSYLWDSNRFDPACYEHWNICLELKAAKTLFTSNDYVVRYKNQGAIFEKTLVRTKDEIKKEITNYKNPKINNDFVDYITEEVEKLQSYCKTQVPNIQGPEFANILYLYNKLHEKKEKK